MAGSTLRPVLRRLLSALLVLWIAATTAYLALLAAPGDTVDSIVGDGADTPQIRAQIIAEWGWTSRYSCSTSTTWAG